MMFPRVAARLLNTPLMVHPGKAAAILAGLGGRVTGGAVRFDGEAVAHVARGRERLGTIDERLGTIDERLGEAFRKRGSKPYPVVNGVAVINVEGSLVHKGAFVESDSGETSYQGIQTQVKAVLTDPSVKAVAFEVDSYGGEVSGAFETSDMIQALSRAKPTIAILSDHAYSAGYLMAAAARQIVVPETGGVGSIGVITMHTDMSGALENAGVKVTILKAGAHKADGNPYEPLPDDVAATIRADLEEARKMFAGRVAAYRGNRLSFEAAMATEARTYSGRDAVTAGLADATGHPSDVFKAFIAAVNRV